MGGGKKQKNKHQHNGHTRPSTKEPLEAPRSTRNAPKVLSTTRRACDRLTEGWAMTTSLSVSLPEQKTIHTSNRSRSSSSRSCISRIDTYHFGRECKDRFMLISEPTLPLYSRPPSDMLCKSRAIQVPAGEHEHKGPCPTDPALQKTPSRSCRSYTSVTYPPRKM